MEYGRKQPLVGATKASYPAAGCVWYPEVRKCRDHGELLRCSDMYVRSLCDARDDCWYEETSAATIGQCYDNSYIKPCESIPAEGACNEAPAGCSCTVARLYALDSAWILPLSRLGLAAGGVLLENKSIRGARLCLLV
jgi:hypothetical protein